MIERRTRRIQADFGHLGPDDAARSAAAASPARDFTAALRARDDVAVIAEVKKASPSAGMIAGDCNVVGQAMSYQAGGATAISVLCEPEEFHGSFADLAAVRAAVELPVLCKDFVVDPIQLHIARANGADAVLLMVSVLGERLGEYLSLAHELGMQGLVEVHDDAELEVARQAQAMLVGVNGRDLRDLSMNAERARGVMAEAAAIGGVTVVAESGVGSRDDVEAAAHAGADAVLIGSLLMRSAIPGVELERLTGVKRQRHGRVRHV